MLSLPSLSPSTTSPATILRMSTQPNTPTSRVPTSASAPIPTSADVPRINSITISRFPDSLTLSFLPAPVSSSLPVPSSPLLTSAITSSSRPMPARSGGHSRTLTPALVVPLFLLLLSTLAYFGRRKRPPLKPMSGVHIFIESQVNESGPVPTMISFISAPHEAHSPPPPYSAPPSYFSPSSYSPPPPYHMPPSDMNLTS
ncbi:hypothetical protein PHLGIDRAFT_233454 [Phlebiopsis gigantea 11061_1 CR5-6]|uniref:Uncharacterized protein n=1 Tax=Phlebiopsis gigantea (strain 11061_1 CR5-6) TaxID=745531 RepID=A0A0C3S256_PHLG1|nr:hypothetical protein PHLGIDRAFT_233454 [Phlebiopsis gigantea 11061_1 CR5-6]